KNTTLNVEGMTCANCALGIRKQLEKKGLEDVNVNFSTGEVLFKNTKNLSLQEIKDGINKLGYKVVEDNGHNDDHHGHHHHNHSDFSIEKKFYFCLVFTVPLFFHMFFPKDFFLNNVWVQLGLCLPV